MKENAYIRVLKIILLLEVIFPFLNMTNPTTDFFWIKEHFDLKNAGALHFLEAMSH